MDALDDDEREALERVGIKTALDVLCLTPNELARRLQIPDAQHITDKVAIALAPVPEIIGGPTYVDPCERIKTGDAELDTLLGGGIMTGTIWEVVGESSAGKTQLALQLAIAAMTSPTSAKLERSTCYLSTKSSFPTERLVQIFQNRPYFSNSQNTVDEMLELLTYRHLASSEDLISLLSLELPKLVEQREAVGAPLKLLVIDALAPLVAFDGPPTPALLRERTQTLNEIGSLLDTLAREHNFAVLAVNEVSDVFLRDNRPTTQADYPSQKGKSKNNYTQYTNAGIMLSWESQADWFARTPQKLVDIGAIDQSERKEAKLGLAWAYRIHARIMLSRTNRKWLDPTVERIINPDATTSASVAVASTGVSAIVSGPPAKKRRLDGSSAQSHISVSGSPHATHVSAPASPSILQAHPAPDSVSDPTSIPPHPSTSSPIMPHPTNPTIVTPSNFNPTPVAIAKRNLSLLFSKSSPRGSIDYLILASGIETLEGTTHIEDVVPEVRVQPYSKFKSRVGRSGNSSNSTSQGLRTTQTPSQPQGPRSDSGKRNIATMSTSAENMMQQSIHSPALIPVTTLDAPIDATRSSSPSSNTNAGSLATQSPAAVSAPPTYSANDPNTNANRDEAVDWEFYFPDAFGQDLTHSGVYNDGSSEPDLEIGPGFGTGGDRDVDTDSRALSANTTDDHDHDHDYLDMDVEIGGVVVGEDGNPSTDDDDLHVEGAEEYLDADNVLNEDIDQDTEYDLELDLDDAMLELDHLDFDLLMDTANAPRASPHSIDTLNDARPKETRSSGETSLGGVGDRVSPSPSEAETELADEDNDLERRAVNPVGHVERGDLSRRAPSLTSARSLPH